LFICSGARLPLVEPALDGPRLPVLELEFDPNRWKPLFDVLVFARLLPAASFAFPAPPRVDDGREAFVPAVGEPSGRLVAGRSAKPELRAPAVSRDSVETGDLLVAPFVPGRAALPPKPAAEPPDRLPGCAAELPLDSAPLASAPEFALIGEKWPSF